MCIYVIEQRKSPLDTKLPLALSRCCLRLLVSVCFIQVPVDAFVWPNTFPEKMSNRTPAVQVDIDVSCNIAVIFAVVGVMEARLLRSLDAAAPYCVCACVYTLAINSCSLALNRNL